MPMFTEPFFKPPVLVLISPLGIPVYCFAIALAGKQHAHGIHLFKKLTHVSLGILLLPVAVCNKIINEVLFGRAPALAVPTAAAQVIHKIGDHFFWRCAHQAAEQQEGIRQNEMVMGNTIPGAGLPF